MHPTGFMLDALIEQFNVASNDPEVLSKYSDAVKLRRFIAPAMQQIMVRLLNSLEQGAAYAYVDMEVKEDTTYYKLPPSVYSVVKVECVDSDGRMIRDLMPRGLRERPSESWRLEGVPGVYEIKTADRGMLAGETLRVWYIPNWEIAPHRGVASTIADGATTVTLGDVPTLGFHDRRVNGYVGQVLRVVPSAGEIQERVISASTVGAGSYTVTVRTPLSGVETPGYEIVPPAVDCMVQAVGYYAAQQALGVKKSSQAAQQARMMYKDARKTFMDMVMAGDGRVGPHFEVSTEGGRRERSGVPLGGWVM